MTGYEGKLVPKNKYAFNKSGPKRLEVAYPLSISKVSIRLDGSEVGAIEGRKALKAGRDFKLTDGSTLNVKLVSNFMSSEIQVLRDGVPLPGSASDPKTVLANAYGALYFIAIVNIAVGLGTELFHIEFLNSLSAGWFSVGFGIVFAVLGYAVHERWKSALWIALVTFLVDTGFLLSALVIERQSAGFGGMLVRLFLFGAMIRGFDAIERLNIAEAAFEADKDPKRSQPQKKAPSIWTAREKSLMIVVCILVVAISGFLYPLTQSGLRGPTSGRATAVPPNAAGLPATQGPPPIPIIVYPRDYTELVLNLKAQTPQPTINLPNAPATEPLFPGDLAWNKPTFANRYYADGYPSSSTSGGSGWRSADSDGSWLYVDLGKPQTIHQLIVNHFVDANFTNSPQSYYIVSDDLISWRVIVDEINTANSYMRFKPRLITFKEDVTARYVGIYAQNWHGGWGGVQSFSAIPPGYNYTQETLPKI
jgi:hypothetical protein